MQTKIVESLPQCTECIAEEHNPINDATFKCKTPTKTTALLCDMHFFQYVEQRLGTGTVEQLALAQGAKGNHHPASKKS